MGYTIRIGNATPWSDSDGARLEAGWAVEGGVSRTEAPEFPNSEIHDGDVVYKVKSPLFGKKINAFDSDYYPWELFCRETGMYDLFFDEDEGLMRRHPGCVKINPQHVAEVKKALALWRKERERNGIATQAGWGEGYDYTLARLLWLEYWMAWAVENCEIPAIENR